MGDEIERGNRSNDRRIEDIREAAARLHATAWHGRKEASAAAHKVDPPATFLARFSIPRQPTDDDEVVYDAIEELALLRVEVAKQQKVIAGIAECGTCGALPGAPCRDGQGDETEPHRARKSEPAARASESNTKESG